MHIAIKSLFVAHVVVPASTVSLVNICLHEHQLALSFQYKHRCNKDVYKRLHGLPS